METLCPEIISSCYKLSEGINKFISGFFKKVIPEHFIVSIVEESKVKHHVSALFKETKKFKQISSVFVSVKELLFSLKNAMQACSLSSTPVSKPDHIDAFST